MGEVVPIAPRRVLEVELPPELLTEVREAANEAGVSVEKFVLWALRSAVVDLGPEKG